MLHPTTRQGKTHLVGMATVLATIVAEEGTVRTKGHKTSAKIRQVTVTKQQAGIITGTTILTEINSENVHRVPSELLVRRERRPSVTICHAVAIATEADNLHSQVSAHALLHTRTVHLT